MGKVRLLSKRDIDVAKAKDRQREIAEGSKLAARVDGYRELAASEEVGLEKFRIETLTRIQAEIDPLVKERELLVEEIAFRRAERAALMVPLDQKWAEVGEKEAVVDTRLSEAALERANLGLAISANIQRERENKIELERIADKRERADGLLTQAERMNTAAAKKLMDATANAKEVTSNAQALEAAVIRREKTVTLMEGLVEQRRKQNDITTKNNDLERVRIRDAYATLERIKQRLK